jgi:bifunctional DNA-binding transcriptional regulator/antitoxin component of YhaV-PrlF toxin-antitoxin module
MAPVVKRDVSGAAAVPAAGAADAPKRRGRKSTTRVSSKNQVTLPVAALARAGLGKGDLVKVEVLGPGQVVLTRIDDLLDRYSGSLPAGTFAPGWLDELRDEWA